MKKFSLKLFAVLFCSALFFSCGTKEVVTSSVAEKHITVQQTTLGVKILLKKTAAEDINYIEVVDSEDGCSSTVNFGTKTSSSFYWPFADEGKTYTLIAKLFGNEEYSEESVTFTVENKCVSVLTYAQDFLDAKLNLIADGNKRLVKLQTNAKDLSEVLSKLPLDSANLKLEIYSGSKRTETEAVSAATFTENTKTGNIQKLVDGYDIIENAAEFGLTAEKMDKLLSANPTYFAKTYIQFTTDTAADVIYSTKLIYTNDTIYTPLAEAASDTASSNSSAPLAK